MAENNNVFRITMYVIGVLVTLTILTVSTMASYIINNDKDSRSRDNELDDKIHLQQINTNKMFNKIMEGQSKMNVTQAVIQRDIKYLKEAR